MRQQATTSNEFVRVVTFLRQYILIGSYSHVMFYVVRVLLLRAHCRKALREKDKGENQILEKYKRS